MELKLKMHSLNKVDKNIEKIGEMFPNCLTERKNNDGEVEMAIDFDMLRQELSAVVVEGPQERYQFTWPEKRKSVLLANAPIAKTLRPCREESVDFDTTGNLYIEGDNLDVLKLLQETYLGKVKMIYIDPPYNTGNDSFVYDDDFSIDGNQFSEISDQYDDDGNVLFDIRQNNEANGRFHTDWLNMIYPRLKVARDLLSDDGVIFISIDDHEVENLKKICDEIFGTVNFVAQIATLNNPKGRSQDKYVATCHEYILIYSKVTLFKGAVSIPKLNDDIKSDYPLQDNDGAYRELELRNTHREFGKHNRPNLFYPFFVDIHGNILLDSVDNLTQAIFPVWNDGFEGCWTWGRSKASDEKKLLTTKKIDGNWKIYRKSYAIQNGETVKKQVKSIWTDNLFHTEKGQKNVNELFETKYKYFQSPKSIELISQMVKMANVNNNDIVLDFFSGSSSTAHAVMQLNAEDRGHRKFIMVQLPEQTEEKSEAYKAEYKNICEIGKERIRRAGKKVNNERIAKIKKELEKAGVVADITALDIGFRVLKLDSTNMKDVYYNPQEYTLDLFSEITDNIKEERTPEDLLFQVMLELGVFLSSKVEQSEIRGKKVFNVSDNYLIACFDDNVTEDTIEQIAKLQPYYFVMRDSSMAGDSVATNFKQIFETYSKDTTIEIL